MRALYSYGKVGIPVYRLGLPPLEGVSPVPESPFVRRANTVFAYVVDLEVFGDAFFPSYTEGDNTMVVATDSMKNFVLAHAADFAGATPEEFLHWIGTRFLARYRHIERVHLRATEIPWSPVLVPAADSFTTSETAVRFHHAERAWASLSLQRDGDAVVVVEHQSGLRGLELMKTGGSAFTGYIQDEYTTLPETTDRPLYVALDVSWRYGSPADLLDPAHARYVAPEQVRDVAQVLFATLADRSIQQLLYCLGQRLLERFPALAEVELVAQNRTRQVLSVSPSQPASKVATDPFPAYGCIRLTLQRSESEGT